MENITYVKIFVCFTNKNCMNYKPGYNETVEALSTRVKLEKWIKHFVWKNESLML
jgi:hypothetical protein